MEPILTTTKRMVFLFHKADQFESKDDIYSRLCVCRWRQHRRRRFAYVPTWASSNRTPPPWSGEGKFQPGSVVESYIYILHAQSRLRHWAFKTEISVLLLLLLWSKPATHFLMCLFRPMGLKIQAIIYLFSMIALSYESAKKVIFCFVPSIRSCKFS